MLCSWYYLTQRNRCKIYIQTSLNINMYSSSLPTIRMSKTVTRYRLDGSRVPVLIHVPLVGNQWSWLCHQLKKKNPLMSHYRHQRAGMVVRAAAARGDNISSVAGLDGAWAVKYLVIIYIIVHAVIEGCVSCAALCSTTYSPGSVTTITAKLNTHPGLPSPRNTLTWSNTRNAPATKRMV